MFLPAKLVQYLYLTLFYLSTLLSQHFLSNNTALPFKAQHSQKKIKNFKLTELRFPNLSGSFLISIVHFALQALSILFSLAMPTNLAYELNLSFYSANLLAHFQF